MDGNAPFAGGYNYFNTSSPQQINSTLSQGFPTTVAFNPVTAPGPLIWAADPKGPNPYILQWSMGIQHELAPNLAVEVNYVGNSAMFGRPSVQRHIFNKLGIVFPERPHPFPFWNKELAHRSKMGGIRGAFLA